MIVDIKARDVFLLLCFFLKGIRKLPISENSITEICFLERDGYNGAARFIYESCVVMTINCNRVVNEAVGRVLEKFFLLADEHSLPFRKCLFDALIANVYDGLFLENPNQYGNQHSIILDQVINNISENSNVLDLGCGTGNNALWLAEKGMKVRAVDISNKAILLLKDKINQSKYNENKSNIILYHSSIEKYLKNDTVLYDLVLCQNSLQFDLDWISRMKDIQYRTSLGGYNVFSGPLECTQTGYWNCLDEGKILCLYQNRDIICNNKFKNKYNNGDSECQRLHFIAKKKIIGTNTTQHS